MKLTKNRVISIVYTLLLIAFLIHSGFFSALVNSSHNEQKKTSTEIKALSELESISQDASFEVKQQAALRYKAALEERISGQSQFPTLAQVGFSGFLKWCKFGLPWLIALVFVRFFGRNYHKIKLRKPLICASFTAICPSVTNIYLNLYQPKCLDGFKMEIDHIPDYLITTIIK